MTIKSPVMSYQVSELDLDEITRTNSKYTVSNKSWKVLILTAQLDILDVVVFNSVTCIILGIKFGLKNGSKL